MTRKLFLVVISTLAFSASLFAGDASRPSSETGRYMVVMRRSTPATSLRLVANAADSIEHRVRRFEHLGSLAMDLTEAEALELRRSGNVESVEPIVPMMAQEVGPPVLPNHNFEIQLTPWGVSAIHAPAVWPVTRGRNVNVAVIDSGIDTKHPDLVRAYAGGYNVIDPSKPPEDDYGHGTHVAGIIAAADNSFGLVGVAPDVKLWAVKVLAQDGSGNDERVVAALDWIIAKKKEVGGPWVVNMSLGGSGSNALKSACQRSLDAGLILVASSGNTGAFIGLLYPAGYEGVLAVGAVDSARVVPHFSTHGTGLDVMAPGVDVTSTYLRNKTQYAEVESAGQTLPGYAVINSPIGVVEAEFVNCGYGWPADIPAHALGRICVIQRSPAAPDALPFAWKARYAKDAGAVGVVLYNDDDTKRPDFAKWELWRDEELLTYSFPLTIAMSYADGQKLLDTFTGTIKMSYGYREYVSLNGTSMAAPHVAGTAALMLSLVPNANFATIEGILERTTTDLNTPGWDYFSAWGMVDALKAARAIAPSAFGGGSGSGGGGGSTANPPPTTGKRHSTRH